MMKRTLIIAGIVGLVIPVCGIYGQNINGERILVGRESITIINFPDKVLNINFSDDDAYDYYIPKRREEKSISIQFNKEQQTGPNTGLLVNEGGRSHMFRLTFDSTYNINDDSRPPLWYDHSSLKELKSFVQHQKEMLAKAGDETANQKAQDKEQDAKRKKQAEDKKAATAEAKEKQQQAAAQKAKNAEKQRHAQEAAQRKESEALAKAEKEAREKEKQLLATQQKEAAAKKAAEQKAQQEAEALVKQQALAQQRIKELEAKQQAAAAAKEKELQALKASQDAEALAKAEKEKALKASQDAEALAKARQEAAETKRKQEEALAKKREAEQGAQKKAEQEAAKKEAERLAAAEKLVALEAARKAQEAEKAYSEVGLWQRYGKKGIDVYNIPAGQMSLVNADFFIAADTLRNFHIADSLIGVDIPDKLNIAAGELVNKGVSFTLENIYFKDIHTYYKIKIHNDTDEDFLLGKTYMYWYDENEKPKMVIKGSYLTYISFYPIVRPHTERYIVFATRSPNVTEAESLVLFIEDRRKDIGGTSIVINGKDYIGELAKLEDTVQKTTEVKKIPPASPELEKTKSKKKKKKKRD